MSNGRSTTDLLKFLDYLAEKGLMPAATAAARKASANKMLAVLSDEEARDVTTIDMDDVALRFHNKNGQQYTPGSIQTYKSRVTSSIDDFRAYLTNPLGFRTSSKPRQRTRSTKDKPAAPSGEPSTNSAQEPPQAQSPAPSVSSGPSLSILPVALRPDLTIQIAGLPFDLTKAEAQKLANIILAHAVPD
tara:strand:+ start:1064 stop:1630 length:567 start_codon:yes stop_codon:yes gene_type:complete